MNCTKEEVMSPAVKTYRDFRAFSQAGRDLAHWHLDYETVDCYPGVAVEEVLSSASSQAPTVIDRRYRVEKMKFAKRKDPETGKSVNDKTTVIYNDYITLKSIPLKSYEYIVNGKPALDWIMEHYQITIDKASGIKNDPNDWCREHDNPRYIVDLIKRGTHVSLVTVKIVGFRR